MSLCTGVNKQQFTADDFVPVCVMEACEGVGGLIADTVGDSGYDLQFAGEKRKDGSNPENQSWWRSGVLIFRGRFDQIVSRWQRSPGEKAARTNSRPKDTNPKLWVHMLLVAQL